LQLAKSREHLYFNIQLTSNTSNRVYDDAELALALGKHMFPSMN